MKDPIIKKNTFPVMFSFLIIGSIAALYQMYHSTKYLEHMLVSDKEEDDENFFV